MLRRIVATDLRPGETGIIFRGTWKGTFRRKMLEFGFVSGTELTCVEKAPGGDPIAFRIRGEVLAIRKSESDRLWVIIDK